MTDLDDHAPASEALTGTIGARIAQTFKNRAVRLKAEETTSVPVESTQTMTPSFATPVAMPAASPAPPVAPPLVPPLPQVASAGTSDKPDKSVSVGLAPSGRKAKTQAARVRTGSRRARLRVSRVDPWSVMKIALLFSVAMWIIFIVATYVVFMVVDKTGLYEAVNGAVASVFAAPDAVNAFNVRDWVNTTRATAVAALVGAVNVVITTALATIFAFLYNLAALVMGGVEITMAED